MTSDRDDCAALLRRFGVPYKHGKRDGRATINIEVPSAIAGRVTAEHPGVSITLEFVRGGFVGIVHDGESGP
jgi:hypothetical protein